MIMNRRLLCIALVLSLMITLLPSAAGNRSAAQAEWAQAEVRGNEILLPGGSCAYIVHLPGGAKD